MTPHRAYVATYCSPRGIRSVSDACGSFQERQPQQQRALVSSLMEKAIWKARKFEWILKTPFQILAHSNFVSQSKKREEPGSGQETEIWLPKNASINGPLKNASN
jgi:hypothetical protein